MRALVTGGAGFIGSHLVDILKADGHKVVVVDPALPVDAFPAGVVHWKDRVQDAEVPKRMRVDLVFHLAGPVGPVGVIKQAGKIVPEIVTEAEWLKQFTCPVVFVSTSEVYGEQHQPVAEDRPTIISPDNSARAEYAVGKLAAEMMLRNSLRQLRIVRPFNVAGPRQSSEGGFVLPRFIEAAMAGANLTVYGNGTMVRSLTHVKDVVDGIYAAGLAGKSGTIYNLGNEANACSIGELAERVIDVLGSSSVAKYADPVALHGRGFHEAADKVATTAAAYSGLTWSPKYDLEAIIKDAANWYAERLTAAEAVGEKSARDLYLRPINPDPASALAKTPPPDRG